MVKIDGNKVKALRESQELTQLYVATAVGVTTDTISRWENKRYPTIKKKNCLKLAEALGVDYHEILDQDDATDHIPANIDTKEIPSTTKAENSLPGNASAETKKELNTGNKKKPAGVIILSILTFTLTAAFFLQKSCQPAAITAKRHCPEHFIPNLPFPVVIEIDDHDSPELPYVVTETFSKQCNVISTLPEINTKKITGTTLKWFNKDNKSNLFLYALKTNQKENQIKFRGTVSNTKSADSIVISGVTSTVPGVYHWADTDKDNKISDKEILEAYNLYNGVPLIDFDLIEEIWMGNGYTWDNKKQAILISM